MAFAMGQETSIERFIRYLRQSAQLQSNSRHGAVLRQQPPGFARAALDLHFPVRRQAETEYIYCIKLPSFECTPRAPAAATVQPLSLRQAAVRQRYRPRYQPYSLYPRPSGVTTPFTQLAQQAAAQHQWIPHEMVKIGKSKRPAHRFHEILGAFQNLGVQVPLLQHIRSTDDPQTTLQKAKFIDSVVFLLKVQDIGTAEEDIRKDLGISLEQRFIDNFLSCLDEEQKKPFQDNAGMTEWVLMDSGLAVDLQWSFRYSQLCRSHLDVRVSMGAYGHFLPRGDEATRQLRTRGLNSYLQRNMSKKLPPEFRILFQPTNFCFENHT